jgi:hypothetical protein
VRWLRRERERETETERERESLKRESTASSGRQPPGRITNAPPVKR